MANSKINSKNVSKKQIALIEKFAFEKASKCDFNHAKDHIERTVKLAELIAKKEKANLEVCKVAALLHDIGRSVHKEHCGLSTAMARVFLKKLKLKKEFIDEVCHTIVCHDDSAVKYARTLEAKILYDADKLQIISVFGFCRSLTYRANVLKMTLQELMPDCMEKRQNNCFNLLHTLTAKKLIKKQRVFMKEFYKQYRIWDSADFK